jgi:hypothetical protein
VIIDVLTMAELATSNMRVNDALMAAIDAATEISVGNHDFARLSDALLLIANEVNTTTELLRAVVNANNLPDPQPQGN